MMLLFSPAYQNLRSKSPASCILLRYNFPPDLHTCFLIYILMIRYYPINLSEEMFGCLQFWFFFAHYMMDDNPIGSLWKPMSFVRGLYYELYCSFPLFAPNGGYYRMRMFIILQIFFNMQENVYEQTTVYGLSVFSEMILGTKETFSFYNKAFHLESS